MVKIHYTDSAKKDIERLTQYGHREHGEEAVSLYLKLIQHTVTILSEDHNPIAAKPILGVMMYHLKYQKHAISLHQQMVKSPSHFIFYRFIDDDTLEILRILNDRMDPTLHL